MLTSIEVDIESDTLKTPKKEINFVLKNALKMRNEMLNNKNLSELDRNYWEYIIFRVGRIQIMTMFYF